MEAIHSSDTSVLARATRHHIPEDEILVSHRRESLKSYSVQAMFQRVLFCNPANKRDGGVTYSKKNEVMKQR
jgi:hypothetical protein